MSQSELNPPSPEGAVSELPGHWRMAEHWPELVVAVTEQSIESVSLLLRGLDLLMSKGRITPAEYKVLALPAEKLKHCGMHAQQIVRFQSGRVRQSHEKIDLAYLLECVLQERRTELTLMGVTVRRKFKPAEILIDPTLGFSLAKAMLDWSTPFGNRVDIRLDIDSQTAQARLWMKTHTDREPPQSAVFEDGINWLLLRQIASTDGGIDVERSAGVDGVELTAVFRRTIESALTETSAPGADTVPDTETLHRSINGTQALVLSTDADCRLDAANTLKKIGVSVDTATNPSQALEVLRQREIHLVVLDQPEAETDGWTALYSELAANHPDTKLVRLGPTGSTTPAGTAHSIVARDDIRAHLGSVAMFSLSKDD